MEKPKKEGKVKLLRYKKNVSYNGKTYKLENPRKSTRKGKKFMIDIVDKSTGKKYVRHWGAAGMSDYIQHRDPKRRERFQKRHQAIKLKSGEPAHKNPLQPAYLATHLNW